MIVSAPKKEPDIPLIRFQMKFILPLETFFSTLTTHSDSPQYSIINFDCTNTEHNIIRDKVGCEIVNRKKTYLGAMMY